MLDPSFHQGVQCELCAPIAPGMHQVLKFIVSITNDSNLRLAWCSFSIKYLHPWTPWVPAKLRWSWGPRSKPPSRRGSFKKRMRRTLRILIMHHEFSQLKAAATHCKTCAACFQTAYIRRKSMHPRIWSNLSSGPSSPSSIFSIRSIPNSNLSSEVRCDPSTVAMARLYNRLRDDDKSLKLGSESNVTSDHKPGEHELSLYAML